MLDTQILRSGLHLSTDSASRRILERPSNRPLVDLLTPGLFSNLILTQTNLRLDRNPNGFNGTPSIIPAYNNIGVARAIFTYPDPDSVEPALTSKVFQSGYTKFGPNGSLYEDGEFIEHAIDKPIPYNPEFNTVSDEMSDALNRITIRDLMYRFIGSTLLELDTIPLTDVKSVPMFVFTSINSNSPNPVRHLASVNITNEYWNS